MGRLCPVPWEQREACPTCGEKVAYLPLGKYCLLCGYLWVGAVRRRMIAAMEPYRGSDTVRGRFVFWLDMWWLRRMMRKVGKH